MLSSCYFYFQFPIALVMKFMTTSYILNFFRYSIIHVCGIIDYAFLYFLCAQATFFHFVFTLFFFFFRMCWSIYHWSFVPVVLLQYIFVNLEIKCKTFNISYNLGGGVNWEINFKTFNITNILFYVSIYNVPK